jgi:hypothetical protein
MFIDDDLIDVVLFYKGSGKHYTVYGEAEFKSNNYPEDEAKTFNKVTIKVKQLTWGLYNAIQESAMVVDQLGNRKWNYKMYKENKLKHIICSWDAKMKSGDKMIDAPINADVIAKLSPEIAEAILNLYDDLTLVDEAEEKKS